MSELFRNKYRIKSIRLPDWDYSSEGLYFLTICTRNRECILGDVVNDKIKLSKIGEIVEKCWNEIPKHFINVVLDEFVVMPNHVHGIIEITNCRDGVTPSLHKPPLHRPTLGQIIGYFKYQTTRIINRIRNTPYVPIWQSRFYEHVIRNEIELNSIREYIINNPLKWELDRNNIKNHKI